MAKTRNPAAEMALMRAKKLSPARRSEIASQGGTAGSAALTDNQRSARAKKAAEARWGKKKAGVVVKKGSK